MPLVLCLVAATWLFLAGQREVAWFVGNVGPVVVVLLNGVYVLVFDPKKRWRQ